MIPTVAALLALAAPDRVVEFNRDVRPILSDHCFACHGFDAKARKAKLRLDTPDGAFAKREDGPAITPGDLGKSEVWARVVSSDPDAVMPPPHTNKPLSAEKKAVLKRWIEQGAKYQKHWAFEPIRRPTGAGIDHFLNERITAAGLTPQPEADRPTLIRRTAFALTGLPPTVKEVDAFLADDKPGAYERMVDRYLASPRFGEEMARHWLDVARYADTHGLHLDNERTMWLYRDWVVSAFNKNLPFDQFTKWQVAGDLLPNATPEQLVATGFNRCNVTTSEGGAIDAEFAYRYAVERTSTVATAFLGLTAGCAVCHDHKYDPISQREFYSLYAFFNNAADPAMDGNINVTPPFVRVPTPAQKAVIEAAMQAEAGARKLLETAVMAGEFAEPAAGSPKRAVRDVIFDDALPPGAGADSSSRNAIVWTTDAKFGARAIRQASAVGYRDTLRFNGRPVVLPEDAAFEVWLRVDAVEVPANVSISFDGTARKGKPATGGKTVTWNRTAAGLTRDKGETVKPGEWTRLTVKAADIGLSPGHAVKTISFSQTGGIATWDRMEVVGTSNPTEDALESFDDWRTLLGTNPPADVPGDLHAAIRAGEKAKADDMAKLRRFYLGFVARPRPELATAREAWERLREARVTAEKSAPGTFVYNDRAGNPKESFVMLRGQYDKPGEKVVPDVPAILPKMTVQGRPTRLDLANWLVATENPLTARVTVNRLWQQFFGTGLVRTSFDFGSQGEPPSHPELLDWLAADFREGGWDVKRFVKQLVTSAAFRRASAFTPAIRAKDLDNRLYARGPRFRLDAEQLRDNALFVGGLLNPAMGGRGVNPYQPANIWEPVGYADSNTRFFQQDHGQALYRRSLYVFLKRTAPPPFMATFDGPNREQVCSVRERTNTPLQALQLMNDVQHLEAARALAERAITEGGKTAEERIGFLYRTVLSRKPDADEVKVVTAAAEKQLAVFKADPAAAAKAVRVGESKPKAADAVETAAWTMVANLILNLDETVTRN